MSDWLKALLGVEDREIPADAVTSFEFANLPRGAAALATLLIFVALVAGIVWIYRREGSASRRSKMLLATIRCLIVACAFLVVLEPVLSIDQVTHIDKTTVLLLDDSLSMTVRDRYRSEGAAERLQNAYPGVDPARLKRYELLNAALDTTGLPGALARSNAVSAFRFADGIVEHATIPRVAEGVRAPGMAPIDPEAPANRKRAARGTNLAGSIREAVEAVGSDRVAGIVLLTDGRHTVGPPAEDVAVYLKNKDLVLHTVVVGQDEPLWNLRAVSLAGPDRVYRNDPVAFEAQISSRGFATTNVVFERRYSDEAGEWTRIDAKDVSFPNDDQVVDLKFGDRPPRVGPVEYRIRMEAQDEESTAADNEKIFVTRVVEEKAKVLLVAGGPAHEYYAVKNLLLRDTTITLACFLQSADPAFPQDGNGISLSELPADEKSLFFFDVVILHDPNGDLFPPGWPGLLRKFVSEHRGGLCFVAGNKNTLKLLRQRGEQLDMTGLLPVVLDLDRADMPGIGIGYGGYFDTQSPWDPEPDAFIHPATRFHSDARRARGAVWDRLPYFFWFFPTLKEKPGARVLVRHGAARERVEPYGRRPLIAVHRYGGGNVMFLAADETHRWRSVAEPIFDRFWVQTARFLLEGRHSGARRRYRIYLDRDVANLGEAVQITVEAFDESFEPFRAESTKVLINGPEDLEEVTLMPVEGKDGRFSGSFAPSTIGDYEMRPADKRFLATKQAEETPSASFVVELPDLEMGNVRADETLLKDLAARTRGRFVPLHALRQLARADLIPPASERVVTQGRPIPLWDTWTTIVVILSLLCLEWILRKRQRMV